MFFDDFKNLKEGDYLFADGSFAHERSELKELIGRVFSLSSSDIENQYGWTHGRILGSPIIIQKNYLGIEQKVYPSANWGEAKDLPFPHTHYTSDDIKHFDKINSNLFSELLIKDQYTVSESAFNIARNWNRTIPIKNASKWYLPNWSQCGLISRFYLDSDVSSIWTSSQGDKENAVLYYCGSLAFYSLKNKSNKHIVVPIFSF